MTASNLRLDGYGCGEGSAHGLGRGYARRNGKTLLHLALACLLAAPVVCSAGEGFATLLAAARQNDSEYRAASAARDAGLQGRIAGRAQLLPSVSAAYEYGNSDVNRSYLPGSALAPLSYAATSRTLSWRVLQPLFNMERWYSSKEEDARSVLAELNFVSASTELSLRLSRSVFDTLLAADNLQLAQAQYKTLTSQRVEAENLRKAGVLTLTDVEDTRSRELSAEAGAIEAAFGLQMRRRELARIVGVLQPDSPNLINAWSLAPPMPNDLEQWLERVRDGNPKMLSAAMSLEVAGYSEAKARAVHLPTLDLIASSSNTKNPNNYTSLERSGGVSLRLNVPIYEGGRTTALAQRATALKAQSREELDTARRDAETKAAEAFLGMGNATAKSRALEQALVAAQTSLKGATVGRQLGLRTQTEVLNAQQQVFSVQRDLSKERYNHALAYLQLKALAGRLGDEDFSVLDQANLANQK